MKKLHAALQAGVSAVEAGSITVHTITPLADTGAYELALEVRSRYFDPRSRDLVTKPVVVVREDGHDYSIGPIYVPSDGASEGSLFEYRLESTRTDGTTRSGTRWIAADRLRLILGRVQVEAALAEEP